MSASPPSAAFEQRSLERLDWPHVLDELATAARTLRGARTLRQLPPRDSAAAIRADFDAIDDLRAIEAEGGPLPVGGVGDIADLVGVAQRGGVLDPGDLREVARSLVSLRDLGARLQESADFAPTLGAVGSRIDIDGWVVDELDRAFDATGQLSAAAYPELGELRSRIQGLHETIRRTLDGLLHSDDLEDLLQDRYVTQRGERYVLPIKAHAKNWDLGIVHGTSGSGRTVYVEPNEVIALNNKLRIAEGELAAEERRILGMLSQRLARIAPAVHEGLDAATDVDLACARDALGQRLGATRPSVGEDGVIDLKSARHPVLLLRGVAVVPNDLHLDPQQPVLVLTGPNTGGKTVALKTLGLCALLVRAGCFVPAAEGSRVDCFATVLADIGDTQTVEADLSSFSGHLVSLRQMLDAAGPGALFLLDELCSGTDPAQGGALARAVLEAFLDRGPRVVVTTHYLQLKGLAQSDPRFAVAAMEYARGRPTYRVVHGATGESHAFDTALRMGLAPELIARAEGLMGASERLLGEALAALEAQTSRARDAADAAEALRADLERRDRALAEREQTLRDRARELEQREAAKFLERLKQAERAIGAVVADLQRAPDHRKVDAARATVDALATLVPVEIPEVVAPSVLAIGDRVRLRSGGQVGEVSQLAEGSVQVRIGALTVRARPDDIERLGARDPAPTAAPPPRKAKLSVPAIDLAAAVRVPGNTLDLRGQRVDEAFDAADRFFAAAALRNHDAVFLLHGHGTGALKDGLRSWLRTHSSVERFTPANADQGGDAYTVVALR